MTSNPNATQRGIILCDHCCYEHDADHWYGVMYIVTCDRHGRTDIYPPERVAFGKVSMVKAYV